MTKIIDCKGLNCPQPVINTKKYFDSIENGEATIIVDNEVAKNNVSKFAENSNFKYESEEKDGFYYIKVCKDSAEVISIKSNGKKFIIVISSDKLGQGDDVLGSTLMKSYLYALSESNILPSDLIFLNSGVKLTIENSPCIGSINILKSKGVSIMSCGTCLDFYGLKDKLAIGEITNMYNIVEKMNSSDKTIKI